MITVEDLDRNASEYFTWREVLLLRRWNIYAVPTKEHEQNILDLLQKMDLIREMLGDPIHVTSCYRPPVYNRFIGGSVRSWHRYGMAMDFKVANQPANGVRDFLKEYLDDLEVRMENLPGSGWVHIDTAEPGTSGRYFTP